MSLGGAEHAGTRAPTSPATPARTVVNLWAPARTVRWVASNYGHAGRRSRRGGARRGGPGRGGAQGGVGGHGRAHCTSPRPSACVARVASMVGHPRDPPLVDHHLNARKGRCSSCAIGSEALPEPKAHACRRLSTLCARRQRAMRKGAPAAAQTAVSTTAYRPLAKCLWHATNGLGSSRWALAWSAPRIPAGRRLAGAGRGCEARRPGSSGVRVRFGLMVRGWGEGSGSARLIIDSNSDATTTTRDRSRRRGINDLTLGVNLTR